MRVAGYVRVSTQEQANSGHSVEEQKAKIVAYCDLKEWELIEIYSDPGYTGTNFDRPALQRLLNEFKAYDMVLVFRLDRLSRTQEGALHLVNEFQSNGVAFTSISEQFDTSTPIGKAMLGIAAAFAELDHDTILERMALGRAGRAREGLWRGGSNTPTGYDFIDGRLVPNEDAWQIQEIFKKYLEGWSAHQISVYMHGLVPERYNQTNSVSSILKNPLYKGVIMHNGSSYKGQHEKLISEEDYDAVQALYKSRMDKLTDTQRNPFRATHLLTGLLVCKKCGERYGTDGSTRKNGVLYEYYTCRGKHGWMHTAQSKRKKHCDNKNYRVDRLDNAVIQEIEALSFEQPTPKAPVDHSKDIKKIDKQIDRLIDLYAVGGVSMESLSKKIDALRAKKDALQVVEPPRRKIPTKDDVIKALHSEDFQTRKQVVDSLIDKIEIDGDDVHIYWSF